MTTEVLRDTSGRRLTTLRLSVTGRCGMGCSYCNGAPDDGGEEAEDPGICELARLAGVFTGLGISKIRLTGGEPLVRPDLPELISQIRPLPGLEEISLTTNGLLLEMRADELKFSGVDRVNVSIDSLIPEMFRQLTGVDGLDKVLAGIEAAISAGLTPVHLNMVVIRGKNDGELPALVEYARKAGATARFIELMPVGMSRDKWRESFFPASGMLEKLTPLLASQPGGLPDTSGPARYLPLAGGGEVGIIAGMSKPFCSDCARLRLSPRGGLRLCLTADLDADLLGPLRAGADDATLAGIIRESIKRKPAGGDYGNASVPMSAVGG